MKLIPKLQLVAIILLGMTWSSIGQDYMYQFSTTVSVQQACDCWIEPPPAQYQVTGFTFLVQSMS